MKTLKFLAILGILLGFTTGAVNAQTESTKIVDMTWSVFIPCSGEFGELAVGTLNLHSTLHFNKDGVLTKSHNQPQGGELIGEITGTVFNPTGVTQSMMDVFTENGATTYTYINNFHMVGTGGVQLRIKVRYHVTINANGDVTAEVDNSSTVCK
jgi:hypothetical protein